LIKLENGSEADVEVEQSVSGFGWTNSVTFDFANANFSGSSTTVNAMGSYSRLTLFIDGGVEVSGTYLIDDIDMFQTGLNPNVIDVVYTDIVWSDEFNTAGAIDDSKWFHQTQLPPGQNGSWFNGELQHYTNRDANSFVFDGSLNIVAIKENFTDQGQTKEYTSARLNSKFAFTYGRVDVRAKLPFGDGTWPAIWTLGKNTNEDGAYWDNEGFGITSWPASGEIDIMEHGLGATNHVSSALHTPSSFGNTLNVQSFVLNDVANDYHIYSVNWSPDQITFLIDGVGFYTYNPEIKNIETWPFFEDQYLLLNIAMGGFAGTIDPNFQQSSMVIDYVRVYQNTGLSIDEAFANKFNVFPNPASDYINIVTNEVIDEVQLHNLLGSLLIQESKPGSQINISNLNSGIYLLSIHSGSKKVTKKIVVE
jgi:beta-glucanase (GH16 family)